MTKSAATLVSFLVCSLCWVGKTENSQLTPPLLLAQTLGFDLSAATMRMDATPLALAEQHLYRWLPSDRGFFRLGFWVDMIKKTLDLCGKKQNQSPQYEYQPTQKAIPFSATCYCASPPIAC